MKKIIVSTLVMLAICATSQNTIPSTTVNGSIQIDENLKVTGLSGTEDRIVIADQNGNLRPMNYSPGPPCESVLLPWALGGNNPNSTLNNIGTCNNVDFILKANNNKSVYIKPNGFVGMGINNSVPTAQLDISDGVTNLNSNTTDHTRILGNFEGAIECTERMSLFFQSAFSIHQGSFIGQNLPFFHIDQLGNTSIVGNTGITGNTSISGRTNVGIQTSSGNLAKFNVNVAGSSNGAVNAIDVFDQYSNKVSFRVKSNGYAYAREINVMPTNISFPDYVFASNYKLMTLKNLESYVNENKHLPHIPTAKKVEEAGINVAEMQILQMEKIEEAFLYIIQLKKENDELKERVDNLESTKK